MRKVAIYVRVSTKAQSVDNQLLELRQIAQRLGYNIVGEYSDHEFSGAKCERPALDSMMTDARRGKFDLVMVWSIDRLGRSLQRLIQVVETFKTLGIDLFFQQQAIDTSTAAGKLTFSIFSALGEYERELIRSRVIAGQERARANGVKLGRPSKLNVSVSSAIRLLRSNGMSIKRIAKELAIGIGTVYKVISVEATISA